MKRTSAASKFVLLTLTLFVLGTAEIFAQDHVLTIYFCGTGATSEWYRPEVSGWHTPELLASLYQSDNSYPITKMVYLGGLVTEIETLGSQPHYKYIVDGLGTDFFSLLGKMDPDFGVRGWTAVASILEATPNPVSVGTSITLKAALDDIATGRSNLLSAEYVLDGGPDWSPVSAMDGNYDSPVENVTITIDAFPLAGVHEVCLRGTDTQDNTGDKACILLAVYDPEDGFVSGGGWIISPVGAYTADPSLTGKVTFGFVSKYQHGATVPTGQTEFQFKMANLNFHSDSYEWLVVSGTKAQYKGSGTINGIGNYGFMLTAFDGQASNTGDIDKLRIRIWDKATDAIVYDNLMGSSDTENPTTALGGGSIVIHNN